MLATPPAILTEGDAILADVLERPDDDTPRLVLADYLEENGEAERAEFIRVQCELAVKDWSCSMWMYSCGEFLPTLEKLAGEGCERCKPWARLTLRERELLGENVSAMPGVVCPRYLKWCEQAGLDPSWVTVPGHSDGADGRGPHSFVRGFVSFVHLPQQTWLDHGPAIVRAAPVTRVRLSDAHPSHVKGTGVWCWWRRGEVAAYGLAVLDESIFRRLSDGEPSDMLHARRYRAKRAAADALSAACLLYAKDADFRAVSLSP